MPIVKTDAFVLKSFKYGDTSKIITLYTKDFGKLSVIAKGARNYTSKFRGLLETMNYLSVIIYLKENRELQFLSHAEYRKSFPHIVKDFKKLQIAYSTIEILKKSVFEYEVVNGSTELLLSVFEKLDVAKSNIPNYYLYFQMNLAKLLGLSPDYSEKGAKEDVMETLFDNNEFNLSISQFKFLRFIDKFTIEDIESLEIDDNTMNRLISEYEKYLLFHTHSSKSYNANKVFKELNKVL